MATEKKAYSLNKNKQWVILNTDVKPTAAEQMLIDTYVRNGWELKLKSAARAAKATARADGLKDADIQEALKNDKKALADYIAIKKQKGKGGGFFAAKKWYKENYQK
jgi:hypothetical protein